MHRNRVAAVVIAVVALGALTGCGREVTGADPTVKSHEVTEAAVAAGRVSVNGTSHQPRSGWSVRCKLSIDEPWLIASPVNSKEQYPSLTAGHGKAGDRWLLLLTEEGKSWAGSEAEGLEFRFDETGLRVSGEVRSGSDYSVRTTIDIDLPCGKAS